MRRFCVASSVLIRRNLTLPVSQNPITSNFLLVNTTQSNIATKLFAVPVRQGSTEGTEDADRVVQKQEELSEAGIAYIQSEEYTERYGSRPVFADYRRNHKGRVPPKRTRLTCVRGKDEKRKVAGNPCPICRDQNLVIHYKNVKLLEQFICPHSREIYSDVRTGVCQKQYKKLGNAIAEARVNGLIPFTVPFVHYDYQEYYGKKENASVS